MAVTGGTNLANKIILSYIEQKLSQKLVALPTLTDHSGEVPQGADRISIPTVGTAPTIGSDQDIDGGDVTKMAIAFTKTDIDINIWKSAPYVVTPALRFQSAAALIEGLAEATSNSWTQFVEDLVIGEVDDTTATAAVADSTGHKIAISDILKAKEQLDKKHVPFDMRYLLVNHATANTLLAISDFKDADKFGSPGPKVNGQIAKAFGFTVVASGSKVLAPTTGSNNGIALAYHSSCYHYAYQLRDVRNVYGASTSSEEIHFRFGFGKAKFDINNRCYKLTGMVK